MQRLISKLIRPLFLITLLILLINLTPGCIARPFKEFTKTALLFPIRALGLAGGYKNIFSLKEENKSLKERVAIMSACLSGLEETARENKRLKKLLNFDEQSASKFIPAQAIARDPDAWMEAVIINKGKKDNISMHMAVVTEKGIVGVVQEVGDNSSKVMLLSDPQFRLAVRLEDCHEDGLLHGMWAGSCKMIYIPEDAEIKIGERVLTSKLGGMFPAGLVVGKVIKVGKEKGRLYKYAVIKPSEDLSSIEEVLCMK